MVVLLVGYLGFLGNCLGAEKMWDFFYFMFRCVFEFVLVVG